MRSLLFFSVLLLPIICCGQLPALAAASDSVEKDSAILVIGDVIVGQYAYIMVVDSNGVKRKYVVFPADVAALFERALHKADQEQPPMELNYWQRKFLDSPDSLKRRGK